MASRQDPRRVAFLVALLVVAGLFALYHQRPGWLSGVIPGVLTGRMPQVGSYSVPPLAWDRDQSRSLSAAEAERNLFTYGPPPTPTPDLRPTPTPAPTMPPRPRPTATPAGVFLDDGSMLPPPPAFTMSYLGWLGPNRLPVAVFQAGDQIRVFPKGSTVEDKFVVREVGPTAVTIGFVGYPDDITTQVSLAR